MNFYVAFLIAVLGVKYSLSAIATDDNRNTITRSFDAKSMLSSLAGNLMSRGFTGFGGDVGGSQVVSLNLTNLVVLVLLKALIFAAGSLGAGTWKGGYARSGDGEERLLTDEEILLYLSYITGTPGNNSCLQSIACQQPQQAKRYAAAADMLLKTARMMSIEPDPNYALVLKELQEATNRGNQGADCSIYACGNEDQKKASSK